MKMIIKKIYNYINSLRFLIAILLYLFAKNNVKEIIKKDVYRWIKIYNLDKINKNFFINLSWLLLYYKEFRNVYTYRVKNTNKILYFIIKCIYPIEKTILITTPEIGGGFVIFHGFATIINANKIGENFTVYQNVTIGNIDGQRPIIEDNVQITTSSVVLGNITIGQNSIIGANTTVTKNVPENCTVVGNQGMIVKENGNKILKKL